MNDWARGGEQLDDEMRQHIELETQQNIDAGMSAEEARYAAFRKFGNVTLAKEESRDVWVRMWLERFWQDVTYALQGFIKSPGFTSVALVSLLLGIGVSTSLFSVVYGVLIAPYPYAKPDEIWAPAVVKPTEKPRGWHTYSRHEYSEIKKLPVFSQVMATSYEPVLLTGESNPRSFFGVLLTGNAFEFIGVKPLIGRTIEAYDIGPNGEPGPVVVLSYNFWKETFNGEASALGKKLVLNDVPHTVIGVMPPRFGWYTNEAFWLPMNMNMGADDFINVIMRLKPGVSRESAEQRLQQLNLQMAAEKPQNYPKGGFLTILRNYMDITSASGEMTSSLRLLSLAVGLLLLIACVNVANLQLARTTTRAKEIALRLSIGAGRVRLIRQLLTESLLLSLIGGGLGVLFALVATHVMAMLLPADYVPNEARITVNEKVLLFSLAVSVVTGILFGLTPAIRSSRMDLAEALKDGGRGTSGSVKGQGMRSWLVIAEVALSVVLLAGAVLAIRGFTGLQKVDPGFQPERTLMVDVPLTSKKYKTLEQRNVFDQALLERVSHLPGVEAAAMGNGGLPFGGPRSTYSLEGQAPAEDKRIVVGLVSSDYLRTMGVRLKRGRQLTAQEVSNGDHLAWINETAAKLWPRGTDPIGRRISVDLLVQAASQQVFAPTNTDAKVTVVGIVADTRNDGLRDVTQPQVYAPYTLLAPPMRRLAIRTVGEPMAIVNSLRRVVQQMDKDLPLQRPITTKEVLGFETVEPRFNMALFSCFAGLGLALAAAGIYSLISYDVAQRMHELGVRVALGAGRGQVLGSVLRMVGKVAGFGLLIGICGSLLLERVVQFQVFAAMPFDWTTAVCVVGVLLAIALAAGWLPAARAARVDPVVALRHEG